MAPMLAQPDMELNLEGWEFMRLLGVFTFALGLVVLIGGLVLRVHSGRARPIAGLIVIAFGTLSIIGGAMNIGRLDPPSGISWWDSPCYGLVEDRQGVAQAVPVRDLEECLQEHYSQTEEGIVGIVCGSALALSGVWLLLPPGRVGHPRSSSRASA
jgi:hypothetical protein